MAVTYLTNWSDRSLLLPCTNQPSLSSLNQHQRCADPLTQFGYDCACFEDDTAYFGNNFVMGNDNPQPSRLACQQSCSKHPRCEYWTWDKRRRWCYLKTRRDGVTHNRPIYVSGSKRCLLPEQDAGLLVQRRGWQCSKTIFIQ